MKQRIVLGVIVLLAVIVSGAAYAVHRAAHKTTGGSVDTNMSQDSSSSSVNITQKSTSTTTANGQTTTTIAPVSISLTADDYGASQTTFTVTKGAVVTITFNVEQEAEYSDGLVFRTADSKLNTGTVKPGTSKSLTFTAGAKIVFLPFWPNGGPQKGYAITVNAS